MTDNAHTRHASNPSLASHSLIHNDLLMYQKLTKWLKECQPEVFSEVMDVSLYYNYLRILELKSEEMRIHVVIVACILFLQAYVRAFRRVYEEQFKGLLKDSRDILQLIRGAEVKKPGGFILSKISGSSVDIRSPIGGSLSSLSPARGSPVVSQSIADFSVSPSLSMSSQDSFREARYVGSV